MIGVKSLVIALLCALAVGVPVATGALGLDELGRLSVTSCLVLGALTSLCVGLVGTGGGLSRGGGPALDVRRWALVPERAPSSSASSGPPVRQLPGWLLRVLLGASFLAIAATTLGNHGVVRLRELGAGGPAAGRCKDPAAAQAEVAEDEPPPPPPPVDQAGCALVRRAYQLGYARSLGTCAPRQAAAPVPVAPKVALTPEPCTRRQADEPFLHYAWRRWAEAAGWFAEVRPVAGSAKQAEEVRKKLGYFDTLTASSGHALRAVPHAAHHLWIALPDPRPSSWLVQHLAGRDCEARYVDVPLWRSWKPGEEGALVEHALGQLLFASRFGTTTACANYRVHWGASADACARLLTEPEAFLRAEGQWDDVAGVLDRRRRQLELRTLAQLLGRHLPPEPPPATAVVSLSCLRVDATLTRAEVSGRAVTVDGQSLGARQLRLPRIATEGDGPIELVAQLARLLAGAQPASAPSLEELMADLDEEPAPGAGGAAEPSASSPPTTPVPSRPPRPVTTPATPTPPAQPPAAPPAPRVATLLTPEQQRQLLDGAGFSLARLEAIEGTDPFTGDRWALGRKDLVEIYPFQRTLFAFIDGFRRRYHAQRGRL